MKNTLTDLNNYLFEQIERLQSDDVTDEELEQEIKRNEAITKTAKVIIENANIALQAQKHFDDLGNNIKVDIPLLGTNGRTEK